jgi:DNA-binding transcriptional MerR regulator
VSDDDRYSLTELADLAGVTPRTVRYYLAQGLLPAIGQSGPGSKYDATHLLRLRLIRRLQAEHLPLAEIRRRLDDLTEADIRTLATAGEPAPPPDSALDYLRTVLGGTQKPILPPRFARSPIATAVHAPHRLQISEAKSSFPDAPTTPIERSQWERIALAPDVELQIRRPLTRAQQKGIDRLVTIARELLEEDRS